jgi:hypothetical protein
VALTEEPQDATIRDNGVDSDLLADDAEKKKASQPNQALASWIMEKVTRWRLSRNNNYGTEWEKFYRIWRGKWDPSLKHKQAERSRMITPATQSAVDQTVAEMAEAVFGRGMWFDLSDPPPPPPQPPQQQGQPPLPPPVDWLSVEEEVRDNLIEDFSNSRLAADVIETFYNGAIYGEGIAKRVIEKRADGTILVAWEPVSPTGFVIDTAATTIDEALGVAHETIRPFHEIEEKQDSGEYADIEIGRAAAGFGTSDLEKGGLTDFLEIDPQDGVYITEWHGKIPARFLDNDDDSEDADSDLLADDDSGAEDKDKDGEAWVESVVIVANGTHVLKAQKNELNDRGFVAYQHHRSPNSFWGIGVVEKAFNSQSGLDGEVRARQDALALTTYPTVGVDATRMPRNLNMIVAPGKVYLTNGRPSEIIEPIQFGSLNNASFEQSGDLERYVQLATGATDPAKPVNANSTASGQSQQSSAFIKRAKLTMQGVDTDFLSPMIRKSITAYNVLNPKRYPKIPSFTVNSTMSIMAREFEQAQMTNLLAVVPQQSAAFPIILKGIIENYSGPSKDKIIEAIDQSMKPDPATVQYNQQTQQLTLAKLKGDVDKVNAEVKEITTRGGLNASKAKGEDVKTQLAPMQLKIRAQQTGVSAKTADTQARQVEVDAAKAQIDHHHRNLDHVHKKVQNMIALKKAAQPAPVPA